MKSCYDCKHIIVFKNGQSSWCRAPQVKENMGENVCAMYCASARDTGILCGHPARWFQPKEEE